jgi:glycine cleavage system H protein
MALLLDGEAQHTSIEENEPVWVGGFKLLDGLSYHPGHLWAHRVAPDRAFVGIDDFGRRLIGAGARVRVEPMGTVVAPGDPVATVTRNGTTTTLRAPVGGEIVGVNPRLKRDPDIEFRDSYGLGWLYQVSSTKLGKDLSNLLNGTLVRRWMEDTRDRFQHQLMTAHGSVIQDGGGLIEDIGSSLAGDEWRSLTREFLSLDSE